MPWLFCLTQSVVVCHASTHYLDGSFAHQLFHPINPASIGGHSGLSWFKDDGIFALLFEVKH